MFKKGDKSALLIYLAILVVGALIYGLVKDIGVKPPAITEDDVVTVSLYFDGDSDISFDEAYSAWQKVEKEVRKSNGW